MNLTRKTEIIKTAIASLTRDEAPLEEIESSIKEIQAFIAAELHRRGKRPGLLSRLMKK